MGDQRNNPTRSLDVLRDILESVDAQDEYVLFGSMPMYFHGLRREVGDIDVFVRPPIYDVLGDIGEFNEQRPRQDDPPFLVYDKMEPQIHFFFDWTKRDSWMDIERCFRDAQVTDEGWRYAPLTEVTKWKLEAHRPKDIEDLVLINAYWEAVERVT